MHPAHPATHQTKPTRRLLGAAALGAATWLAASLAAAPTARAEPVEALTFDIDPTHSSVSFSIRHLISRVHGRFGSVGGVVQLVPDDLTTTRAEIRIDAASIDTGNEKRDGHLRNEDFFDVEKYPEIRFVAGEVRKISDDSAQVTGELTMRGITKPVTLQVEDVAMMQGQRGMLLGFHAETEIDRNDWDVSWNRALGAESFVLGDDVRIVIDIEARQRVEEDADAE